MVFSTIGEFAVDEGRDQRERGERLPVGRGIVSQEILIANKINRLALGCVFNNMFRQSNPWYVIWKPLAYFLPEQAVNRTKALVYLVIHHAFINREKMFEIDN